MSPLPLLAPPASSPAQAWVPPLRPSAAGSPTAGSPTAGSLRTAPTLALVDLDSFYVSVERLRDPGLVGRPVVVGGLPGERGVVACASYEARGHGVRAGMPLSEAAALLPRRCLRCTEAQGCTAAQAAEPSPGRKAPRAETGCGRGCPVFLHGEHAAYLDASRRVLAVLERFAPKVEPVSLDEAYLDLTGCERHHRSWLEAGLALRAAVLAETGLSVSVGVGSTRAVAGVAAALAKPGGVLVVRAGEERAFLSALPLEHLPGVGPKMREQLTRFHLLTIGDLAQVPESVMEETFGRLGPLLVQRALGREDPGGARVGERQPKSRSISRETSFASDTDDPRVIDGMLSYLAQRAAKALRDEGCVARAVGVRLRYADFDTVEARRRLSEPTDRDQPILEQVRALWRVRWTRRVRLRLVGVVLHDLEPANERQLALPLAGPADGPRSAQVGEESGAYAWQPAAEIPIEVDHAIDRIRERHGFGAVVRGGAIGLLNRPVAPRQRRRRAGPVPGFRLATPGCSR